MKTLYLTLMVITGMVIPVMASLNSALSTHLKSVPAAVVLFFFVALTFAVTLSFIIQGSALLETFKAFSQIPPVYLLGGLGMVIYITSVSIVGPKIGIGVSLACVLLGQLISMTLIDHFAFLGMPQARFSLSRLMGMVFMLVGIVLVLLPSPNQ